jgi:hypothetical protein
MSSGISTPIWIRFLVPSVRDIVFLFLFWSLLAGALANRPLADADIGWHIRTGELIVSNHSLPHFDPFSATMHGQRWMDWEWLYDFVIGALYRAAGLNGVVWLCAVVIASTLTLLLSHLLARGTGLLLAIVLMLFAEAVAAIHMYARPHIASWLFSVAWFIALERWQRSENWRRPKWAVWFFPASMLVWVNLHGGWVFGMAMLALYSLAAWIESLRVHNAFARIRFLKRAGNMAKVLIFSAVATLINPFGWKLHVHIYRYLSDHYLMNHIQEFGSPDFHGWSERWFAFILLLVLIALATSYRKLRLSLLFTILLATYAGFYATRNLPVSSMLLALIIGPILWENFLAIRDRSVGSSWIRVWVDRVVRFSDRMSAQELDFRGHLWPLVAAAGALIICMHGGRLGARQLISAHFDPQKIPVRAVDFLQHEAPPDPQPVLCLDTWSGFLIYRFYPQRKVLMDDRHDFYGPDRVRQYLILMQGEPGWRDVLEEWNINVMILPPDSTLSGLLRELSESWLKVYEDKVAVVWRKR